MRIGIFSDAYKPYISGVVSSINILKSGLEELGHEVYIITIKLPPFDYVDDNEKNVIRLDGKKYPLKNFSNYSYLTNKRKAFKIINQYQFDIIHVHTEFAIGELGLKYAKKNKVPCIATYHTNYEDYFHYFKTVVPNFIQKRILFKLLKSYIRKIQKVSSKYIVPTEKIQKVFERYKFKFDVEIIPSGIDIDKFNGINQDQYKLQELKEKYKLENKFVCTFIGRISEEKSLDVIVRAFAKVNREDVVLLIGGYGPAYQSIVDLTIELNLQDKVVFIGSIPFEQVPLYYNLSNLFLNASVTETQGLTYIEALASSIPLLIKEDEATKEVLINGHNGIYFETEEEFVSSINKLVDDRSYYTSLKVNTLNSVSKFSKENYAISLEKLYLECIDDN